MPTEPKIKRKFQSFPYVLRSSEPLSAAISMDDAAGGAVEIGTVSTSVTSLAVWASESAETSFGRLYKTDGSPVSITISPSTSESRTYSLPDDCYGVGAVKLVANHADATAASCVVMLKG